MTSLRRTPLYSFHQVRDARMTSFSGYDMPLDYMGRGVLKEHLHTRVAASLFDVSHMGQVLLIDETGDPAVALETLSPSSLQDLGVGQMRYTVLLNDQGGVIDDVIVTRIDAHRLGLVLNAGRRDKDIEVLSSLPCRLEKIEGRALLALQGPLAEEILAKILPDVSKLSFMQGAKMGDIFVTRSGYTGEDGFEISLPASGAEEWVEGLLTDDRAQLAGLGARDSLRLEAGLCLYGQELTEEISPVEAGLSFIMGKGRCAEKNFNGAARILKELTQGVTRLRVGMISVTGTPVRTGAVLTNSDGQPCGMVTSGGFAPSMKTAIAMGYIDAPLAVSGTKIFAQVRDVPREMIVTPLPFIKTQYKKGSKA